MSHQINASLSTVNVKVIKEAIEKIVKTMPFLINLTAKERRILFKTGPDSVSFIQNALSAAEDHPEILPDSFSTRKFKEDVDLFTVLTDINTLIASLDSEIDDTRLSLGADAMQAGIQVYDYVKTAAKTTPGLKPVAEQLAERFKRAKRHKTPAEMEE